MVSKKILVTGRVQGVGFRYSTMKRAVSLGLFGEVTNKKNGDVEIMVYGNIEDVERLVEWCKIGPIMANVTNVKVDPLNLGESVTFSDFRIIR